jgi:hypothetical protein
VTKPCETKTVTSYSVRTSTKSFLLKAGPSSELSLLSSGHFTVFNKRSWSVSAGLVRTAPARSRRCGKSTVLGLLIGSVFKGSLFLPHQGRTQSSKFGTMTKVCQCYEDRGQQTRTGATAASPNNADDAPICCNNRAAFLLRQIESQSSHCFLLYFS